MAAPQATPGSDANESTAESPIAELLEPGLPLVVVAVGTDHHRFDRLVGWMDRWAADHAEAQVVIQRGTVEPTDHALSRRLIPHTELCRLFRTAVAVVSHGGPSTIMDARAAGRIPIVLPRDPAHREHVDDHQLRFAAHLAANDIARTVREPEQLAPLLTAALADPASSLVPPTDGAVPGVVAFGLAVDDLLGIHTPIAPAQLRSSQVESHKEER